LEIVMKKIATALTLAGTLAILAAPAHANTCLDIREMVSSTSKDGKIMVFKMRDGTTWVNHLRGSCPDLRFMGFAWTLHSGDTKVCENAQTLQVLQSPQICVLGKFDAPTIGQQAQSAPVMWDANRQQAPR
jgi:hypothetical protein